MTKTIDLELKRWEKRARAALAANPQPTRGDELLLQADIDAMEAIHAQQTANRRALYERQRPTRYTDASYRTLKPAQDPGSKVSRWYTNGPRSLVLAGPPRTGKTTAAYAIANDANNRGDWVMAWTAANLADALKPDRDPNAHDRTVGCTLLLLDDLGRERITEWWLEQLQRIIDDRCANRRRLIVTTNTAATPEAVYDELGQRYGHPLVERLIDGGGVLILNGPAVREVVNDW